jgi:peptide subunit release factor 1 (eRF1)
MTTLNPKEKQKLKRFVRNLEKVRGRHTELVSVYVPAGYDLIKIIQHLQQEQGTASNIKDKTTQTHVIDSLERMIRHLRLFKKTPPNGLAVFSGDTSGTDRTNIEVFSIEPPQPLKMRLYRCDQTFVLEPLIELLDVKETYGLLVLDKREANVGFLKGTSVQEVTSMTSGVPGKTRAGGQCLHPESCVSMADGQCISIEEVQPGDEVLSYDFVTREFKPSKVLEKWETKKSRIYHVSAGEEIVISSADHLFFIEDGTTKPAEQLEVGMMLLNDKANPIPIKDIAIEQREIPLIDIKVEMENFIAEGIIVHNSAQRFARIREEAAKEFFKRISDAANKTFLDVKDIKGILVGGPGTTKNIFLDRGFLNEQLNRKVISVQDLSYTGPFGLKELVDKSKDALVNESIVEEREVMNTFFKLLSTEQKKVAYGEAEVLKALERGAVEKLLISESIDDDKADMFEEKAEETGSELIVISTDTSEGEQLRDLGKVAAILRFALS